MDDKQTDDAMPRIQKDLEAQTITFDDQLEMERNGALAGINPMFGEWQHHFRFAPVPYGNGAAQRGEFRAAIQAELTNQWLYASEISLEITLHVDVQATLETDETADLDNYAKAILDGLKGPNGIMIDDTQVQSLSISWIDGYGEPSFTVASRGSPDDFVLKPQEFYEMPDGLWYPHGRVLWTDGRAEPISDLNHYAGLSIIELMSSTQRRVRAEARKAGSNRGRAYQMGRYVSTSARGFHPSRIEGDFPMHPRREWQAERAKWSKSDAGEFGKIEVILHKMRESHDLMITALTSQS
ncbi:MAG: RusA family crossover junction endodeoxyribonuclease [Mesorhizobium sp.]|uniref:RusA family crossover junction endodeoxyribonuclease n=1 Tax=Mesorhizobium sp. TaxID=1871066 RepID=UPI000FE738F3|nr:RusA family crossover junction endodeoxyribonuclease [Mesorhizobium sp.]RWO28624.1 MAG: RusA family crossover junction endodeoxyribonuclease [Mesorhizobium sp.]